MIQAGAHQVAAQAIFFTHHRHFGQVFIEGQLRGVLDEIRNAKQHAQRQIHQVFTQGFRPDHPAHPPAAHGVGFRQTVDGRGAFGHARQTRRADVLALEQQLAVDLVADQPQVMTNAQCGQGFPGHQWQAGAGWVVWTIEQQGAGLRCDQCRDIRRVDAKTILRTHWHRHHFRPAGAEHAFVGDVHRFGNQHFVARVEQALHHRIHRALRAGEDDHMLGIHHLPAALVMASGDTAAQTLAATHRRVVRVAGQQTINGRVDDGYWRVEIRVANRQQQDIDTLLAQLKRSIVNLPGRRSVTGDSLGQG
ncbi:hypothetical protein D3C87_1364130 [compost metagenome]